MTKTLFFSALLLNISFANAQLSVSPNPFSINSGILTITFGASGDYAIFDPQSDPNLYLYSGLETDGDAETWDYHDDWNTISSLTPLTWNPAENAYTATFDITNRNYVQETTGTSMQIPFGTTVNNWYFIIRNSAGNSQSGRLEGTTYGMTAGTLSNEKFENSKNYFFINKEILSTNIFGKSTIEIYSITGQKLQTFIIDNNNSNFEHKLNISENGILIAVLKNESVTKSIKFVN